MIYQGSNMPLVIGLKDDVSDAQYIHVLLKQGSSDLKHWEKADLTISDNGNCLICPLKQAETLSFPVGKCSATVKWLDADGIVRSAEAMPITVGGVADKHILGTDTAVSETSIVYEADLNDAQGILTPETIRQAIVIKAGTVSDAQASSLVSSWLNSHKSEIKGEPGANGTNGTNGTDGADGKSAYQLAVDGGYSGTQSQWIASLKGEPGTNGKDGVDGKDGRDGTDATVTSSSISTALGYTPANQTHSHSDSDVPGLTQIKQDIAALQTGKADTSHSHTTTDLTDWIPMSTAVKNALTDTTATAWTATEQASARARLGAMKEPGEWVLKGTLTEGNKADNKLVVDMAGCTEYVLYGACESTSDIVSIYTNIGCCVYNMFSTSYKSSIVKFEYGGLITKGYISRSSKNISSPSCADARGSAYDYFGKTISQITRFYTDATSSTTGLSVQIWAR